MNRQMSRFSILIIFWIILSWGLFTSLTAAAAEQSESDEHLLRNHWYIQTDLIGAWNPWGALSMNEATWQMPYRIKNDMVWSHLELGMRFAISPASSKLGIHLEWMPAAFLQIRAHYDANLYHGLLGYLLTFDRFDAPHDEPDIYDLAGTEKVGFGQRFWVMTVLRASYKFVVIRNQTDSVWFSVNSKSPYVFNWEYETLLSPNAFVLDNRIQLLFNLLYHHAPRTLYLGPFYDVIYAPGTNYRRQRTGIDIFTEPFKNAGKWGVPRLFSVIGFNLEERYRTNEFLLIVGIGSTWTL